MEEKVPEIRSLHAADVSAFRRIRLEAVTDSPSAIWPTYAEIARATDQETAARIVRTDTQVVFGAYIDGELVGIARLRREPLAQVRHKALLWGVFVRRGSRREGVARALMGNVLTFARENGMLQIQLCVNVENVRARDLYSSLGFASFGVEPRALRIGDTYIAEEHMVLRLDQ
jgi:ribosomal protein S18 acetylase RimI-like enzyme